MQVFSNTCFYKSLVIPDSRGNSVISLARRVWIARMTCRLKKKRIPTLLSCKSQATFLYMPCPKSILYWLIYIKGNNEYWRKSKILHSWCGTHPGMLNISSCPFHSNSQLWRHIVLFYLSSVDEILRHDHSNETALAVHSHVSFCFLTRCCGSVYLGVIFLGALECIYLGNLHARHFRDWW